MRIHPHLLVVGALVVLTNTGCTDATRFHTDEDEAFCGAITVASDFREGFSPKVQARLRLDGDALARGASPSGSISTFEETDDPDAPIQLLESARLRRIRAVEEDPLSQLNLGDGREDNVVFQLTPSLEGEQPLLSVLTLTSSDNIELRLVRPGLVSDDSGYTSGTRTLFGLFALTRKPGDCGF